MMPLVYKKPPKVLINPLKTDPTKTATLRRLFSQALRGRLSILAQRVKKLIGSENALGLTANYDPGQPRVPAGSPIGGEWTKRDFQSHSEAEHHIVRTGLAESANLSGLSGSEASGVVEGLERSLRYGNHKLKLKSISIGTGAATESNGFGYSGSRVTIGHGGLRDAREHDLESVRSQFADEHLQKRNFASQLAKDTREYLAISVAHEVGHHVETVFEADIHKAVRDTGVSIAEKHVLPLSGYATTHVVEMFAEAHALMSMGHSLEVPINVHKVYKEALKDKTPWSFVVRNQVTANTRWIFHTQSEQVDQFQKWFMEQCAELLWEREADSWWKEYVRRAYEQGAGSAWNQWKNASSMAVQFNNPVQIERVKVLAGRVLTELKNVSQTMATQMTRSLVDGVAQGKSPREVARDLSDTVNGLGVNRANTIAQTETIRAHAEGQLDSLENLGMDQVGVQVEWSTSGLGRTRITGSKKKGFHGGYPSPCKLCKPMQGVVFTIQQARGLIPRHPNCHCGWLPASVGEDTKGQKIGRQQVSTALSDSIRAEIPAASKRTLAQQKSRTTWVGADVSFNAERRRVPKGSPEGGEFLSTKSQKAKQAAVYVGREVQRYSEEHNEPRVAKFFNGLSFPNNEPVDIAVPDSSSVLKHGIELKTITNNSNGKITMDTYAQVRKVNWEKSNKATFHTVVLDDSKVFNAFGPGKHDESKRVIYYRRGVAGSARIQALHVVKDMNELKRLMELPEKSLPEGAKRTDNKLRIGSWKATQDASGRGFFNKKTGQTVKAKK